MASKDALKSTLRDDFENAGKSVVGAGSAIGPSVHWMEYFINYQYS